MFKALTSYCQQLLTATPKRYLQNPDPVAFHATLSDGSKVVYSYLHRCAQLRGFCWVGQNRIGADLGMSPRTVRRHIEELEQAKLIGQGQRGKMETNMIFLRYIIVKGKVMELDLATVLTEWRALVAISDQEYDSPAKRTKMAAHNKASDGASNDERPGLTAQEAGAEASESEETERSAPDEASAEAGEAERSHMSTSDQESSKASKGERSASGGGRSGSGGMSGQEAKSGRTGMSDKLDQGELDQEELDQASCGHMKKKKNNDDDESSLSSTKKEQTRSERSSAQKTALLLLCRYFSDAIVKQFMERYTPELIQEVVSEAEGRTEQIRNRAGWIRVVLDQRSTRPAAATRQASPKYIPNAPEPVSAEPAAAVQEPSAVESEAWAERPLEPLIAVPELPVELQIEARYAWSVVKEQFTATQRLQLAGVTPLGLDRERRLVVQGVRMLERFVDDAHLERQLGRFNITGVQFVPLARRE